MRFGAAVSLLAAMFAGFFVAQVKAVQPNPTPTCVGMTCSVTFTNTGDYYSWPVPAGVDRVSFELYGAQGGKSGGLGGKVTGMLTSIPGFIYVLVGGAGGQGNGVAGGYNGGGPAGVGHNDEGSGGGATDIRSALDLGSRLAVAGGGGGAGGWSGGPGGAGGGLAGNNGGAGQGGAGLGGTQVSGGAAGSTNGGSIGSAGALGQGGAGGSSYSAGGGGGGGGFFGGGGGGPDVDDCCSDGGGGGGGSSWASSIATTAMATQASVRAGSGLAILRYTIAPVVTSFTPAVSESNGSTASFNLAFNQPITGLEIADFNLLGSATGCSVSAVTGSAATYQIDVRGCGHGSLQLQLKPQTVSGEISGPLAAANSTATTFDQIAPTITIVRPAEFASQSSSSFQIQSTEPIIGLTSDDLTVEPATCRKGALTGSSSSWQLEVSACPQNAQVTVTLAASTVSDALGNLAPATAITSSAVTIDYLAATVTSFTRTAERPGLVYRLAFDEPISGLTAEDLSLSGNGCQLGTITAEPASQVGSFASAFAIAVYNCNQQATVSLTLNNHRVVNQAALESPIQSANSQPVVFEIPAPTPTPTATPTPTPTPTSSASPAPSASAEPTPTPTPTPSPSSATTSVRTEVSPPASTTPPTPPTPPSEPVVSIPVELQPVASILLEPIEIIQDAIEPILFDINEAVVAISNPVAEAIKTNRAAASRPLSAAALEGSTTALPESKTDASEPTTPATENQQGVPARVIPLSLEPETAPNWQPAISWAGAIALAASLMAVGLRKLVQRRPKSTSKIQRLRLVS